MPKYGVVVRIDQARPAGPVDVRQAVLEHLDGLYRFALRLTRDPHLAQELAQESVARALERQETTIRDLRAWLFQTLYHAFVTHYRRRLREQSFEEDSPRADRDLESLPHPLPDLIALEDVRRAVEALPQELRTVVWLSDAEDFRLREIAEMLDWPVGTVASRLARGREELRRFLSAYGPPEEKPS